MSISVRASSSNSSTTGTAISVSAPTGTTTGDVVVISLHGNNNTTIVDNNGGTPFTEDLPAYSPNPTGGHTIAIFSRRIQAGDPSTYNFTLGTSGRWSIVAVTFQNPNATSIYDVAPSTSNAANHDDSVTNTETAPSITTLTDNAIHVVCGYSDDGTGGTPSPPAGYTQLQGPVDEPQGVAVKTITPAGSTGTQVYTFTTAAPRVALSFAMKDSTTTQSVPTLLLMGVG